MNKKALTETDIRTKFITPAILGENGSKWDVMTQVREEVYFTKGRVIVRGKTVKRGEAKKADYLLDYKPNVPLAVVEAKDNNQSVGAGMPQALEYADLFLVLLMKLLKPGARAGLVLPDGTLFGEGVKTRIKEALLTECNLHTIVRLPNGVFNLYTGIRTNLLFFTKGAPTKEVWYYEHPYPPGAKSYNKGKPIRIEEFEGERAWWGEEADGFKSRVENEQAWRVSIDTIRAGNFNLDLKNPHNPDTGPGDVDQLLPEYEKLLAQIAEARGQLKAQLMEALNR
jgi:type I restriction-modification system DNA methylase subunit